VESHDTERRRQIALKALSERLHKSTAGDAKQAAGGASQASQEWPSLEGAGEDDDDRKPLIPTSTSTAAAKPESSAAPEKKTEVAPDKPGAAAADEPAATHT